MDRRTVLKAAIAGAAGLISGSALARAPSRGTPSPAERLAALERRHGGRLGVAILDTGSGRRLEHRGEERFLMCSTFKWLAVAAVLQRVDRHEEQLDRRVIFDQAAILHYAPVTREHVGPPGMPVAALCEAAVELSDNTAANLLLASMGGPTAVTRFARHAGDPVTRLDRTEPTLNLATAGDPRDTTTPQAMVGTMQRVLLGTVLSAPSRERLLGWMRACRTGDARLRAGLPAGWSAGDKTGSGAAGETNDVAIIWPPGRAPLLVAAYYAAGRGEAAEHDAVLAEVGRIAASL